jgi:N-acyl-D-amino-acid deacylase
MHDVVIRGGTCFDGLGSEGVVADVAIDGGVIVEIGEIDDDGQLTLDASGQFVVPGFVDGHTHLDAQMFWDPYAGSLLAHGVTSAVMGNCGFTLAPGREDQADLILRSLERAEDMSPVAIERGVRWTWDAFSGYLDAVDKLPKGLNVAAQIGHSALRASVMGERAFTDAATDHDVAKMEIAVREAIAAGAVGFSTSRTHSHLTKAGAPVASRIAEWSEVYRLVMAMAGEKVAMFQLAPERSTEPAELSDFQGRLAALAVASGCPVSFMVGGQQEQYATIEGVVAAGGVAIGQVHVRGFENIFGFRTRLPFDRLPLWRELRAEPFDVQRERLGDREFRNRLVREAEHGEYGPVVGAEVRAPQFERMTIIDAGRPDADEAAEVSVAELAGARRLSPVELMIDLALASDFRQLFRQPIGQISREQVLAGLQRPHTVVAASDSGAHISQILDSNIPTYFLSHWVRSREVFTWAQAIRMLTSIPAQVWGLEGRGALATGKAGDVVVFDPSTVGCEVPEVVNDLPDGGPRLSQRAKGINAIFVNGEQVMVDGKATGSCPGKLLRHGTSRS